MWFDSGGLETTAARGEDGVEFGQAGDVPVGDRLVQQGPEPLGGLEFRTVGRQEGEADPVGDGQTRRSMPTRIVEHEDNAARVPAAGLGVQQPTVTRRGEIDRTGSGVSC